MSVGGDALYRLATVHDGSAQTRLIQLSRDARLRPKEAGAGLVVTGFITHKPELRESSAGFVRTEHLVRDSEALCRADRVADEIGLAMNCGACGAAQDQSTDGREEGPARLG